jgi:rod shape-determining protein MreC
MFEQLSAKRSELLVAVLLLGPLVQFLTTGHRGREPQWIDRLVLAMVRPVEKGLAVSFDAVAHSTSTYVALYGAKEQAKACETALSEVQRKTMQFSEMKLENERLKQALGYAQTTVEGEVLARVIGVNPSMQYRALRIDRGERDGVTVGTAVLTAQGVVGQVIRSVEKSADVLLASDPASRIGGVLQRSRVRGVAVGAQDESKLQLSFVRREEVIIEGETMVTAGSDGIFPPGIPIGVVRNVTRQTSGLFLAADIVPFADLLHLDEVLVLPNTSAASPFTSLPLGAK